jgi:hypothetical protein
MEIAKKKTWYFSRENSDDDERRVRTCPFQRISDPGNKAWRKGAS